MTAAQERQAVQTGLPGQIDTDYHQLFEQSPVASLLVNREGLIMQFNHRAADILLIDPELRSHPDLFGYVRQEDQNVLLAHLQAAFADPGQHSLNIRILTVNGQEFPTRLISMPLAGNPDLLQVTLLEQGQQPKNIKMLSHLAYYDQLTGLPNRLLFADRLRWAIRDARRQKEHLAVMVIDLDNFKQVNDALGHAAGDRFLQIIAGRMAGCLRESDTLSRMGGDEFTILMQHINDAQDAGVAASRLLEAIGQPVALQDREFTSTASIGVCLYPDDGDNADLLIQNADIAMYRSKTGGRNRISFFNESMRLAVNRQNIIESKLRQALQNQTLDVYYQPMVDTETCRITGIEALLRWQPEGSGVISAAQFLPLAENMGLAAAYSEWALLRACRQMKHWLDKGLLRGQPDFRMAVNISAEQLAQAEFIDKIRAVLQASGLPPAYLAVEAAEKVIHQDDQTIVRNLNQLRELGIALYLDDFSQGFNTLQKVSSIHFECLKIDQIYTSVFLESQKVEALLDALVNLAHILGLRVIAEGVENQQAYAWLKAHACDGMQGYFFTRPMPAVEMEMLLELP